MPAIRRLLQLDNMRTSMSSNITNTLTAFVCIMLCPRCNIAHDLENFLERDPAGKIIRMIGCNSPECQKCNEKIELFEALIDSTGREGIRPRKEAFMYDLVDVVEKLVQSPVSSKGVFLTYMALVLYAWCTSNHSRIPP